VVTRATGGGTVTAWTVAGSGLVPTVTAAGGGAVGGPGGAIEP
jgi:hypothetical protein